MPTLAPGYTLVPRWRMMMLPPTTSWPPNFFTPRRRPAESRPLREEPPAFLCAISDYSEFRLRSGDRDDAQQGHLLAVTVAATIVVATALLEHDHLLRLRLGDDLCRNSDFRGVSQRIAFTGEEDFTQRDLVAGFACQLLDRDLVS